MKHLVHLFTFSFILSFSALLFYSCSETHAEGKQDEQVQSATQEEIPQLLSRPEKLTPASEWTQVAQRYDQAAATLQKDPGNGEARVELASLFVNEARITGEHPYYYPAALQMLEGIPETAKQQNENVDFAARYLTASVQLSLHEFAAALETGQKAIERYPTNSGLYGVLVDAYTEMGDYANAVKMSDQMVSLRPDLRSYSRISYLRELHGEVEGSIQAMEMAVGAGLRGSEQQSWCRLQLGQLHERYGELDQAAAQYAEILEQRPHYPFAIAAMGSIEEKKGNKAKALELYDQAIELIPEVGFYEQKAGLLQSEGKVEEAKKLGQEIIEMMGEDQAAGHNMDLEMAKVYLDLLDQPEKTKELAWKAAESRPNNIEVHKLLAKVYYQTNELDAALDHLKKARVTNSKDPELLCLAGLIHIGAGMEEEGKALLTASFTSDPFQSHSLATRAAAYL